MTNERKMELLAEIMDLSPDALSPDTVLEELDEWDSIALISFIAMMDDEFGKVVKGMEVKERKTVAELMAMMEA
ncbi:MAG: acyl carrier protein [Oscillospiraceae bacterium]|jgi:acyl carrier protein|nr:acyl carrier protein [Oscillospiraceae bacterium]